MSKFNWDDHPIVNQQDASMQQSGGQSTGKKFNWEDHPIISSEDSQPKESLGRHALRTALDALPVVGAVAGGAFGGGAGVVEGMGPLSIPLGAAQGVAGASLGAAGGESLKNILKSYLLDEKQTVSDVFKKPAIAAKEGAMWEMGGQAIGAVPGLIKSGAQGVKNFVASKVGPSVEYTPIANKEAVERAASELGLNLPKAVLTDNPTYQKLESGLSQSGSFPAKSIRDTYNNFYKGLENASSKIADLKTPESDFSIGKAIQKDITDQVSASKAPVKELYDSVVPDLQKIPVDQKVVNKVFGQLKKQPIFQTQDGKAFLQEHKDIILNTPELASLKEIRSSLRDLVNGSSLPVDQNRVAALQKAVTSIRNNSIEAMKNGLPKSMHSAVDDLLGEISLADSAHASNISDINSVKSLVGNKDFNSPSTFLSKVGDMKESDLAQKASNLDVTSLKNLKEKFPTVFQKAKTAKINDMIQVSTNPVSGFSDAKFIKQYDNLSKEAKDLIFSTEIQSHIENFKTIKSSIPDKLGPSGTPEGKMMMDMFNPQRNALDYAIKKTLDTSAAPKSLNITSGAAKEVSKSQAIPTFKVITGGASRSSVIPTAMPRAATNKSDDSAKNEAPKKGPEKWANDGAQKIVEHDQTIDQSTIDQLMNSKKGRDLLIKASDLKPGSPQMQKIVNQIQNASVNGDE